MTVHDFGVARIIPTAKEHEASYLTVDPKLILTMAFRGETGMTMTKDKYLDAIANAADELDNTVDKFAAWVSEQDKEYDILFGKRCWCGGFAPCAMHPKDGE